jgi:hypothetical protein
MQDHGRTSRSSTSKLNADKRDLHRMIVLRCHKISWYDQFKPGLQLITRSFRSDHPWRKPEIAADPPERRPESRPSRSD